MRAFYTQMKKNSGDVLRGSGMTDYAAAAMQQLELYCAAHPGSPSAVRRPRLVIRGELWIALLGPSVEEGIVGIGPNVNAALRAFDAQYLAGLQSPVGALAEGRPQRRADATTRRAVRRSRAETKSRAGFSDAPLS